MADLTEISSSSSFGGQQKVYSHLSVECNCTMKFSIFIPPKEGDTSRKFPVLYFLPGRGNSAESFTSSSIYQEHAAKYNLVVVVSDTSPRDTGLPTVRQGKQVYGENAGMFLDAMTPGWKDHYRMFSYVTKELISVVERSFDYVLAGRRGILGHSMGAHGALICALKSPDVFLSVSCSAPIANVSSNDSQNTIGKPGSYEIYLGTDKEVWKQWDAYELMRSYKGRPLDILVYAGATDQMWADLKFWQLVKGVHGKDNINLRLKMRAGMDHGFRFLRAIIEEQVKYHASVLYV